MLGQDGPCHDTIKKLRPYVTINAQWKGYLEDTIQQHLKKCGERNKNIWWKQFNVAVGFVHKSLTLYIIPISLFYFSLTTSVLSSLRWLVLCSNRERITIYGVLSTYLYSWKQVKELYYAWTESELIWVNCSA